MNALHSPELEPSIRAACIPDEPALPSDPKVEAAQAEDKTAESQSAKEEKDEEGLYPAVHLMKLFASRLYRLITVFNNPLAQDCIVISPRALGNGRSTYLLEESAIFVIIVDVTARSFGLFSKRSSNTSAALLFSRTIYR